MVALATLADVKARLDFSGTEHDALLTRFLAAATAAAEGLANRPLVRATVITEYPRSTPRQTRFARLQHWPIESITSVKQLYATGTDAEFTAETSLVENEDYVINAELGMIERINSAWVLGPRALQVVYAGGYIDPADASPPAGSVQPPEALQHGIAQQVIWYWNTRDQAGVEKIDLGGTSGGGGGGVTLAKSKPHPDLVAACKQLRRYSI